eukprot:30819-Amphidinium_carterae.2
MATVTESFGAMTVTQKPFQRHLMVVELFGWKDRALRGTLPGMALKLTHSHRLANTYCPSFCLLGQAGHIVATWADTGK